ncbi:MAG TPA: DUF2865 domain-containing protein [Xanthobacteraceae bacterium]|jgi:hypothetical protein|nr:DUF2865 domain-containing protein [Xanthobacteraceae bacterium]
MLEKARVLGPIMSRDVVGALFGLLVSSTAALAQSTPPVPTPYRPAPAPPPLGVSQSAPSQQAPNQPAPSQPAPNQPAANQPAPSPPGANQAASNPVCYRLQQQLASVDQGAADPARADQIKRADEAIAKQQADLDRALSQAHKAGCAGEGFFALFSALSPQCGPITSTIQQMRGNLDRMTSEEQQLKTGGGEAQEGQRRALIGALAQNNCGAQYASAAASSGPANFFDALFGNGTVVNPSGDGAPTGTYHTVCVRTCDGYYFPMSYSTNATRFADDEKSCQRLCPASEATLYSFRNPGESMDQAVSNTGQPYTALPNAYRYRKEMVSGCSCRRPGQSWADALKGADDSTTLEQGDIVVTDQNAKLLSQAPKLRGTAPATSQPGTAVTAASTPAASTSTDPGKRTVRTVGPPFLSLGQMQMQQQQQSQQPQ